MANILYSAYFCKPGEGSESYTAVKWLDILLKAHNVVLLTNRSSADALQNYYTQLPANLRIIAFDIPAWLEKKRKIQLHTGYFSFNRKSYAFLRKNPDIVEWTDVILRKTPSSFRYFTSLSKLSKPLVVGPLGGGLQVPPQLKSYFKREALLNKFRKLDRLLLTIPPFRSQLKRADTILITLDYLRDILPSQYKNKMTTLFDTGIDTSDLIEKNRSVEGKKNLLYVGKLIRYKGAELLLRALLPLKNRTDIAVHIVGDGVERTFLEAYTKNNGLAHLVNFHGNLEREQVFRFYAAADIFCAPSLTEASGNVLLEAMLYRLPIITINNGGPKYMCPEEGAIKINISHEEDIVNEITAGIKLLLNDEQRRTTMGEANYRFLQENYSWEVLEGKINAFFSTYGKPAKKELWA